MAHQPQALAPQVASPCQVGKWHHTIILAFTGNREDWFLWWPGTLAPYLSSPPHVIREIFASVINICNIPAGTNLRYPYVAHNLSCSLMERVESWSFWMFVWTCYGRNSLRGRWYRGGSISLCETLGFKCQLCLVHVVQAHYTYWASPTSASHPSAWQ